jgi:hypothetical protein
MFGKPKPKKETLLATKDVQQDKSELAEIEAEIAERHEIMLGFFLPYKDIMAQINSLKYKIAFEKNNFGGDDSTSKKELAALEREAVAVDQACKNALKKSGQLDKFAELNERKMALLRVDSSESQYKPPSISKTSPRG